MKNLKQVYYHVFYVFYKRKQKSESILSSDFIASLYVIILEICLFMSLTNYYNPIFSTNSAILGNYVLITIVALLVLLNYILLQRKDKWKYVIKEFDKFSTEKKQKNRNLVYAIILIIVVNLVFSFYLSFAKAKKDQTGPYSPEFIAKERREDSLQKAQQIEKLKKIYGEDKK